MIRITTPPNEIHMTTTHHKKRVLAFNQCEQWNAKHPPGTPVTLKKDDGTTLETTTKSHAILSEASYPVIWLTGVTGYYLLDRVTARPIDALEQKKLQLRDHVTKIRKAIGGNAYSADTMNAIWDSVFDAEALLDGKPTLLSGSAEAIADTLLGHFRKFDERQRHIDPDTHDPVVARRTLAALILAAGGSITVTPEIQQNLKPEMHIGVAATVDGKRTFYVQ